MPRTDPSDRWIRARRGGETSFFAFAAEDVRGVEWTPLDDVPGHVAVAWEAVDEWLDEEELLVAYARDPFTRIDVRRSSRHVVIEHEGELIADSRSAVLLFETGLPVRYYLPSEDVRDLEPSPTRKRCAYKGGGRGLLPQLRGCRLGLQRSPL